MRLQIAPRETEDKNAWSSSCHSGRKDSIWLLFNELRTVIQDWPLPWVSCHHPRFWVNPTMSHAVAKSGLYWGRGGSSPDQGRLERGEGMSSHVSAHGSGWPFTCARPAGWAHDPAEEPPPDWLFPLFSSNLEAVTSMVLLTPGWTWRIGISTAQHTRTSGCEVFLASPARTGVCWL